MNGYVRVAPPLHPGSLFFACPKKSDQKKGHPDGATSLCASRLGHGGHPTAHPCAGGRRARSLARPFGRSARGLRCSGAPYGGVEQLHAIALWLSLTQVQSRLNMLGLDITSTAETEFQLTLARDPMYIFFSPQSAPMLLDSFEEMKSTYRLLIEFLSSPKSTLTLSAKTKGSPAPYDTFLSGLRVTKTKGPIHLALTDDGFLDLNGSPENLSHYVASFKFGENEEGEHHHPEHAFRDGQSLHGYLAPESLSLIIEVDSGHVGELGDTS